MPPLAGITAWLCYAALVLIPHGESKQRQHTKRELVRQA